MSGQYGIVRIFALLYFFGSIYNVTLLFELLKVGDGVGLAVLKFAIKILWSLSSPIEAYISIEYTKQHKIYFDQ